MNIFLTLDYELFFGKSGSVDNCIIKPTQDILKIVEPQQIKISFFVDSGFLLALERQKENFTSLVIDYTKVVNQLKYLAVNGHGIELHVHPHWEDSFFDGEKWVFNLERYKLSDFDDNEVLDIVTRYTEVIKRITGKTPKAYRAGGWSAQPFGPIQKGLNNNNIFVDSSVFAKGFHKSDNQIYDFKNVPQFNTEYNFSQDLTIEDRNGNFTEIPISSFKVRPWFFWSFAIIKIFKAIRHKPYGDGSAIQMPKTEMLRLLFSSSYSVVSIDGFKASIIDKAFKLYKRNTNNRGNFVLIGHPKAFTPYSLLKVKKFIERIHLSHNFVTYSSYR